MTIYKNVLNTNLYTKELYVKINYNMQVEIVKFRKDNKNTKSHILEILIKLIQSGVKLVYDRG
ncbi:hypothetical protein C6497_00285 [Candidatus Poribacteria bacterium]|nr:MAG: hypothetical protein C6497_00285 [Candidatus Poribacteria bacterium]